MTPSMPDTSTASSMSQRDHVPPLRVSVTTLSCSVASVNGAAVEAATVSMIAVTGICTVSEGPLYSAMASAPTVKVRLVSVSMLPSNSSLTVISVSLTRKMPKEEAIVTPSMPDTSTASSMSQRDHVPPLRVSVTTLSCSVVSVNGDAVETLSVGVSPSFPGSSGCSGCSGGWPPSGSSSSLTGPSASVVAVTGICAVSEGPLYPTMASAPTVKVRVASVSMLSSNSSSMVTTVSLTRSMPKVPTVTPSMPDTSTASLMSKANRS